MRSARPATTANNTTNTPITAQAGVVSTTYVCVTVVAEVCVAAAVVGVITWVKADAVLAGLSLSALRGSFFSYQFCFASVLRLEAHLF